MQGHGNLLLTLRPLLQPLVQLEELDELELGSLPTKVFNSEKNFFKFIEKKSFIFYIITLI
jgi:hypothetical protein